MAARRTLIDANCCVASLRKPLDTLDLHHFAAAARRPFSRAGHQQTFKYRHWPIQTATSETLGSLTCSAGFGCFGYFNEVPGVDVVDVAVNRNMLCDERMLTDAAYVLNHTRSLILDGVPFYELTCARSMTVLRIRPSFTVKLCGFQTISKQIADHVVREKLHATVGVVDDKPLAVPRKTLP